MKFKEQPSEFTGTIYKSRHAEGDPVIIHFGTSGFIKNCRVTKVHFGGHRIAYDVEVKWQHEWTHHEGMSEFLTARIHNIDSVRVFSPNDFETIETSIQSKAHFIIRLKAYVEKCLVKMGMKPYDLREEFRTKLFDVLGEGAVDYLKVGDCVKKNVPKQNNTIDNEEK